ncbi:MAG: helix-turn-helix transcriptional regulator [Candidatus Latescibacter sp.]|nr:helix-turn-helix transcriptional regulator [Candidatus Latescibacter sp.]
MSDVKKYIGKRKKADKSFNEGFDAGYETFKIGVLLKQAREEAGLTQQQIAEKLHTKKSAVSRMENHAEDIRLSTLEKFASALGKRMEIAIR